MAYTTAEARQELLDAFADAIERIGAALGALGAAYEQLDDPPARRVSDGLDCSHTKMCTTSVT